MARGGWVFAVAGWPATLLVAGAGGVYLARCGQFLLSPGVPVRFDYATAEGQATARASSFAVDPWKRSVVLTGVDVRDSRGVQVLGASSVAARMVGSGYVVHSKSANIRVVRDKAGDFGFGGLVPKPTKGAPAPVIDATVDTVHALYVDQTQLPELAREVRFETLHWLQGTDESVASARVRWQGIDPSQIGLQTGKDGRFWVGLKGLRGDLAPISPVVERYLDAGALASYRRLRWNRLNVDGRVEVSGDGKAVDVRGDLQLDAPTVGVGDFDLRNLSARVTGSLANLVVQARTDSAGATARFEGAGAVADGLDLGGKFELRATSDRSLAELKKSLPAGLTFQQAKATGSLRLVNGAFSAAGSAQFASVQMQGERLAKADSRFVVNGQTVTLSLDKGNWRGSPIRGAFQANLARGTAAGYADLTTTDIGALLRNYKIEGVSGTAKSRAVIGGSLKAPRVDLVSTGRASVRIDKEKTINLGRFEARARLTKSGATIQRFLASGENGTVVARGEFDAQRKTISGTASVGAVPLEKLLDGAKGLAFGKGTFGGTFDRPSFSARLESYGASYRDIHAAQVVAELTGNKDRIDVQRVTAISGTGIAEGRGALNLRSREIEGTFGARSISLASYAGAEVSGTVNVSEGRIGGTFDHPTAAAVANADRITLQGNTLENLSARLILDGDRAVLERGIAQLNGGAVELNGDYSFNKDEGSITAKADKVGLSEVFLAQGELSLGGTIGGKLEAKYRNKAWNGTGNLSLANVTANGSPIGAGSFDVGSHDGIWTARGDLGSVDRFLSLSSLEFDPTSKAFDAKVAAYNIELNDWIRATKRYWSSVWADAPEWLDETTGNLTGSAELHGDDKTWVMENGDLEARSLKLAGRNAGTLTAQIKREPDRWRLASAQWQSEGSVLNGAGMLTDGGEMDAKVSVSDLDLSWVNVLFPETPLITGKATATMVASGDKSDPIGRASLLVNQATVAYGDGQKSSDPIQLLLEEISFGNRKIDVSGHATYLGFTGSIAAMVPYSALDKNANADREPLSAALRFDDRPLADFKDQLSGLDFNKSDGTVALAAAVSGYVDDLLVSARGRFQSGQLTFKDSETSLRDVDADLAVNGQTAKLAVKAKSSAGGSANIDLDAHIAQLFSGPAWADALLDESTLRGKLVADNWKWSQKMPGAKEPTLGNVTGQLGVAGSLRQPKLDGKIGVDGLIVRLPEEIVASASTVPSIDPRFDNVAISVATGSRIDTAVGPLVVKGTGRINGSLTEPDLYLPLRLEAGVFRLPSGRIVLEPGGQIVVSYASLGGGQPVARADLDLEGHTTVVSRRNGVYEPFQVTMGIQGNVMDEKNLHLTAYSDPPDLSQEEILALIGQRDLIQGLAQGVGGQSDKLRDSLYSIAVPAFSQNLTQGIAQGLKLDYFAVDYNPFDQFVLSAGKTVGKGLVLQATRQLQGTGFAPLRYEVKLVYRLPVADRFFSRVRLAVGFDQSTPFKVSVNWSKKF